MAPPESSKLEFKVDRKRTTLGIVDRRANEQRDCSVMPFAIPTVASVSTSNKEMNQWRHREKHQLTLMKDGKSHELEFVPQPDSVAVLLYHLQQRKFLFLRKFRPAVFASRVRQLPENRVRISEKVKWNIAGRLIGYTIELCSGSIDNGKNVEDMALAIVEEEFGYRVEKKKLMHIASFVTGTSYSGARRHLYYAVIDETEKTSEGRTGERDSVHKWLSVNETAQLLNSLDPHTSTADYYALLWLFNKKGKWASAQSNHQLARNLFSVQYDDSPVHSVRVTPFTKAKKEKSLTILIDDNGVTRTWDTTPPLFDMFSVLIKETNEEKEEKEEEEVVLTRRFRPAVLISRAMVLSENEGKSITEIDFASYPSEWAYTLELASDRVLSGETDSDAVLRIAATQLGYRIPREELQLKTKLVIGSSHGGDSKHIYYAECGKEQRIEGWTEMEGVERVKYRCSEARSMLRMDNFEFPLLPSVLVAFDRCLTQ